MHFRNITRKLNPRQKDEAKFSFILHGTVNSLHSKSDGNVYNTDNK